MIDGDDGWGAMRLFHDPTPTRTNVYCLLRQSVGQAQHGGSTEAPGQDGGLVDGRHANGRRCRGHVGLLQREVGDGWKRKRQASRRRVEFSAHGISMEWAWKGRGGLRRSGTGVTLLLRRARRGAIG